MPYYKNDLLSTEQKRQAILNKPIHTEQDFLTLGIDLITNHNFFSYYHENHDIYNSLLINLHSLAYKHKLDLIYLFLLFLNKRIEQAAQYNQYDQEKNTTHNQEVISLFRQTSCIIVPMAFSFLTMILVYTNTNTADNTKTDDNKFELLIFPLFLITAGYCFYQISNMIDMAGNHDQTSLLPFQTNQSVVKKVHEVLSWYEKTYPTDSRYILSAFQSNQINANERQMHKPMFFAYQKTSCFITQRNCETPTQTPRHYKDISSSSY